MSHSVTPIMRTLSVNVLCLPFLFSNKLMLLGSNLVNLCKLTATEVLSQPWLVM